MVMVRHFSGTRLAWLTAQTLQERRGDCHASSAADIRSPPRDAIRAQALRKNYPRNQRAQGRPDAGRAHGPRAEKKHAAEPRVWPETPGLPCATVLTAYTYSPGGPALLPTSTTSSSAECLSSAKPKLRCGTPRPSHSAPRSVTIAGRAAGGAGGGGHNADSAKL